MNMDRMQISPATKVHLSRHAMRADIDLALALLTWERPPVKEITRILRDAAASHEEGEEAMRELLRPSRGGQWT